MTKQASFDFSGASVLVAGGTSGINLGVAEAFARAGARVFVFSRTQQKVEQALAKLWATGAEAAGSCADVRDSEAVGRAVAEAVAFFGAIDVVVSGAAGNFPSRAAAISSNGFRAVLEIDVLGTHHVMSACYPHLRRPGASVINISAPQAQRAMAGQAHVCAAKAGVDMLTRSLALEWGPEGIRVNGVLPGPIGGTEGMSRLAPSESARAAVAASAPMRRLGSAGDVASACLFLSSVQASYIQGAIIPVDGGWTLNLSGDALEPALRALDESKRES